MSEAMSGPRVLTPRGAPAPPKGAGTTPAELEGSGARRPAATMERVAATTMAATFAMQFALRPSGPGNSSLVDVFTLLSLLAAGLWAASGAVRIRVPYGLGAGLMILAGALAGLVSEFPGHSLLTVLQDVVLLAWTCAVVAVAQSPGRARLLASAWGYSAITCAGVLVFGSLAHIGAITGVVGREGNRALFTFGDPNYAAAFWVSSIFVCYASGVPKRRALKLGAYLLLLWAVVLSESNGAWLELAAGWLLVLAVLAYRRQGAVGSVTVVTVVVALAAILVTAVPLSSLQTAARGSGQPLLVNSIGRSNASSNQRSVLIKESLDLYNRGSVLGTGPSTTKDLLTAKGYPYAKEAHDDFLASLVERGPIGVLGLLLLMASAAYRGVRVLRAPPGPTAPGGLPQPVGLVGALMAMAAASTYYEVLHFRFVWALLALVAVCAYEADRTAATRPRQDAP